MTHWLWLSYESLLLWMSNKIGGTREMLLAGLESLIGYRTIQRREIVVSSGDASVLKVCLDWLLVDELCCHVIPF